MAVPDTSVASRRPPRTWATANQHLPGFCVRGSIDNASTQRASKPASSVWRATQHRPSPVNTAYRLGSHVTRTPTAPNSSTASSSARQSCPNTGHPALDAPASHCSALSLTPRQRSLRESSLRASSLWRTPATAVAAAAVWPALLRRARSFWVGRSSQFASPDVARSQLIGRGNRDRAATRGSLRRRHTALVRQRRAHGWRAVTTLASWLLRTSPIPPRTVSDSLALLMPSCSMAT